MSRNCTVTSSGKSCKPMFNKLKPSSYRKPGQVRRVKKQTSHRIRQQVKTIVDNEILDNLEPIAGCVYPMKDDVFFIVNSPKGITMKTARRARISITVG